MIATIDVSTPSDESSMSAWKTQIAHESQNLAKFSLKIFKIYIFQIVERKAQKRGAYRE